MHQAQEEAGGQNDEDEPSVAIRRADAAAEAWSRN